MTLSATNSRAHHGELKSQMYGAHASELDQIEIFGPDGPNPAEQFAHNEVVAGLLVDDIDAAINELRQAGIELIGERKTTDGRYSWQHFRAPDGKVFELCHDPDR